MKFSVLIPVYNTEKYIGECVDALLAQSYHDFEIILVDDGSTDGSPVICDSFAKGHPQIIRVIHQNNSGQLVSRVSAVRSASGDYCVFVDSDDKLMDNALGSIADLLDEYGAPDMLVFPFLYDREGELSPSRSLFDGTRRFDADSINELRVNIFSDILLNSIWTKIVKTDILRKSVYDVDKFSALRCSEDRLQSFWVLDNVKNAVYIDKPFYKYRLAPGSVTRTFSVNNIDKLNTSALYEEEMSFLVKWGFDASEWLEILDGKYVSYLSYVFDQFYMNVPKNDRKGVLDYPWIKFVPKEMDISKVPENTTVSEINKDLFDWILNKKTNEIKNFYLKKRTYQFFRSIKRKVIK